MIDSTDCKMVWTDRSEAYSERAQLNSDPQHPHLEKLSSPPLGLPDDPLLSYTDAN